MRGARVVVTGGAGTIGSTVVDQLISAGAAEIVVLDNFVRGRRENLQSALSRFDVKIVEGDIRDRSLLAEICSSANLVVHLAAIRINQCAEEPRLALEVLVDGTFNVFEAAAAAKVDRVVFASSASVYGAAPEFPTTEAANPYGNRTLYGAAKLWGEGLLRSFAAMYGLEYVALRFFNVYGPRMDIYGAYTEVLIRWMERIERGESPVINGDGSQTMDFVYVDDVARAILAAGTSPVTDAVFNIASGVETSLDELARALLRVMGSDLSPEYRSSTGVIDVPRRLASTDLAAAKLAYRAEVDLEEGLRRLVKWWHSQQVEVASK